MTICKNIKPPKLLRQTDRQTDRQTHDGCSSSPSSVAHTYRPSPPRTQTDEWMRRSVLWLTGCAAVSPSERRLSSFCSVSEKMFVKSKKTLSVPLASSSSEQTWLLLRIRLRFRFGFRFRIRFRIRFRSISPTTTCQSICWILCSVTQVVILTDVLMFGELERASCRVCCISISD